MKISYVSKQVAKLLKKRSPEILTGIGIAGLVTTTIMAVRATPKALRLIEDAGYKKGSSENPIEDMEYTPLTNIEMVKVAWKCYVPSVITGTLSIACIVGASSVNAKRHAALATAYTLSETAIREYKDKVVEAIGEKKEQSIRDELAKEKIEKSPIVEDRVIRTGSGSTLCFDPWSGQYFWSDAEKIRKSVNDLNYQLINDGYVTLNDFYYLLGLDENRSGETLGWDIKDGQVQFRFSSQVAENGTPCLVLEFANHPKSAYAY